MLIADFLPSLLVDAPECPDETARQAIVAAARELCRESLVWNVIQDPFPLTDNEPVYDIETYDEAEPVLVMEAWLPTSRLFSKTMAEIGRLLQNWQVASGSTPVYFNSVDGETTVRVFPIPLNSQRQPLTLRTAFRPTRAATTLPDALINNWDELLLQGARSKLFMQSRKPWTDAKLAVVNGEQFEGGKVVARIKVLHENAPGSITVQPREFGF